MKSRPLLQLVSLLAIVIGQVLAQQKNMFCYYTNWSQYHKGREFFPEQINTNYCTHLLFAFARVSGNQLTPYEWNDIVDYNRPTGLYYRFNQLKNRNSALKTLLAVGGWNHGGANFSIMASTPATRQHFTTTSMDYLRKHGFDGLDIDWEYPGDPTRGGKPEDKVNFATLVREIKAAFIAESQRTGKPRLLLTAAVATSYTKVAKGYDVLSLSRDLDFINVMTYDLHGAWDRRTGHNAGLYTAPTDTDNFSVSQLALNWARQADRRKINVGIPAYGRTWTLADPANNGVGAATIGPGTKGQYSGEGGILTYYEVCNALNQGYTRRFDSQTKTPYAFKGNQWITYDNAISLQYKMSWIRQNGFAGAMLWTIDEDDFNGRSCGQGAYPLTSVVNQCLTQGQNCNPGDGGSLPLSTMHPFITTARPTYIPPVTTPMYGNQDCPHYPGIFRDRYDCAKYWMCFSPNHKYRFSCPNPTVFDPNYNVCAYRNNVSCNMHFGR